jgi:ferric-dicitrate binding protein FerR (iron transport regulator)
MTDELIRRFLKGECTAAEAEEIAAYLKRNPAVLEEHLNKQEWDETKVASMPDKSWSDAWQKIEEKRKPAARIVWMKRTAVAASIIFLVGAGYNYLFRENDTHPATDTTIAHQRLIDTMNNSHENMHIRLPDSSVVLLAPGSVITYNTPFDNDKRDVQLEGEGRFIVMKDKTRPFTVYAGDLATTALGTEFTINTKTPGNKTISVRLHTGKVVIKQTGNVSKAWKNDIYLDPGDQLEYNPSSLAVSVSKINVSKRDVVSSVKPATRKRKTETVTTDDLVFKSSPLSEVIAKIEKHFGTNITYDSLETKGMNFTGTISRNDSLPIVLKVIAQMNELELTPENDGFRLSKQ